MITSISNQGFPKLENLASLDIFKPPKPPDLWRSETRVFRVWK